jgi:hypothetical protein
MHHFNVQRAVSCFFICLSILTLITCNSKQSNYEKQKKEILLRAVKLIEAGNCDSSTKVLGEQVLLMQVNQIEKDTDYDMAALALALAYKDNKCGQVASGQAVPISEDIGPKITSIEAVKHEFNSLINSMSLPDSLTIIKNIKEFDGVNGFGPMKWRMTPRQFLSLSKENPFVNVDFYIKSLGVSETWFNGVKDSFELNFPEWRYLLCGSYVAQPEAQQSPTVEWTESRKVESTECFDYDATNEAKPYDKKGIMSILLDNPLKMDSVHYTSEAYFLKNYGGFFAFRIMNGDDAFGGDQYTRHPPSLNYFGGFDKCIEISADGGFSWSARIQKIKTNFTLIESFPFSRQSCTPRECRLLLAPLFSKYGIGNTIFTNDLVYSKLFIGKNSIAEYAIHFNSAKSMQVTILIKAVSCNFPTCFIAIDKADSLTSVIRQQDSLKTAEDTKEKNEITEQENKRRDSINRLEEMKKSNKLQF